MDKNEMQTADLRALKCTECDWGLGGEMERNLLVIVTCNCGDPECILIERPLCPAHVVTGLMRRVFNQEAAHAIKQRSEAEYLDLLDDYDQWIAQGRPPRFENGEGNGDFMMPEIDL